MTEEDDELLSIGATALAVGVPVRTLRSWAEKGYVVPTGGSVGGHVRYTRSDRVRAIIFRSLREGGQGIGACMVTLRVLGALGYIGR